jgi:hypothetical protein
VTPAAAAGRVYNYTRVRDSLAVGRAEAVPAQLTVPCLGRPYGPNWWPRHGTIYGSCPALALKGTCRAVLVPCFLVPCPGRSTVLVPFGQL